MKTESSKGFIQLLRENPSIVVVCVATALSMLGQGIISPVLPLFAREFGVGAAAIGAVVGVFGLGRLLFNMPAGFLGQRFGRRLIMGGGLLLAGIGTGLMGTAGNVPQLVAWRFLAGAGSALFVTGGFAYIIEISTPQNRGRFMSLQQASLLLGVDIGPPIGGVVADTVGFTWPFYLAGVLIAVSGLWVLVRLPESKALDDRASPSPRGGRGPERSRYWQITLSLLSSPTFLLVSLFTLLVFFTRTGSMFSLLPLMAVELLDLSATQLGVLFTVSAAINFVIVLPVGALTDRLGRKAIILPGTLLAVLGLFLFVFGNQVWIYYLAAMVYGAGGGMIGPAPAAYAGDLAPPGGTAITMGLYRSFGDVGFVVGPILLGLIADATSLGRAMGSNAVALMIVGVALMVVAKETAGRRISPSPSLVGGKNSDSR